MTKRRRRRREEKQPEVDVYILDRKGGKERWRNEENRGVWGGSSQTIRMRRRRKIRAGAVGQTRLSFLRGNSLVLFREEETRTSLLRK